MPKILSELIEEAKKEFEKFMENPIAFDKGGCLRLDEKALLIFFESQMRLAYKEGAEEMKNMMVQTKYEGIEKAAKILLGNKVETFSEALKTKR